MSSQSAKVRRCAVAARLWAILGEGYYWAFSGPLKHGMFAIALLSSLTVWCEGISPEGREALNHNESEKG